MPKTIQRSNQPQATSFKGSKRLPTVRVTATEQDFDSLFRPGRRPRRTPKQAVDDEDMARPGVKSGKAPLREAPSDLSRTVRASSAPSADFPGRLTKTGRISKARKGQPVHSCDRCGKVYTRAEHLRRHQLNHNTPTQACPWPGCPKQFFRDDLLTRHVEDHREALKTSGTGDLPTSEPPAASSIPPTLYHSPSGTPSYPEFSFGRHMEPPAPVTKRQRTHSEPLIHNTSQPIYSSPNMYGGTGNAGSSFNLEVPHLPHANYTWHSAPSTFGHSSPLFDGLHASTPVSAASYDTATLAAHTPHHADMSMTASPYTTSYEAHSTHQESYPFTTHPPYQEALFGPTALDPSLDPSGVGDSGAIPPLEYFPLGGVEESEQGYRGGEGAEHSYH